VQVRLGFTGNPDIATIFWTGLATSDYSALETTMSETWVAGYVDHFSQAFVGTACQGDDCCSRAVPSLDMLFVVDNSNSMAEEQQNLARQLPRVARAVASGDLDADGTQDFPAVGSLHLAIVSTDMGTGGFRVPTCVEHNFGDDGILRTDGQGSIPRCDRSYPAVHTFDAGDPLADPDEFAANVACVSTLGTGGCGFEQPLEAMLKALTPSTMSTRFQMGTPGHGDGLNAGFLRDRSVVAVVHFTDENDCSAHDPELFNPSTSIYTGDLNLRCFSHDSAIHPVSRYVNGLLAVRPRPQELVFGVIAGIPPEIVGDGAHPDFDAILDDRMMQERIDHGSFGGLEPSCDVPELGRAYPPRRLVETARDLDAVGAAAVLHSICSDDYTPAVDAILSRVARRIAGSCD
jgi:hypothetical protein